MQNQNQEVFQASDKVRERQRIRINYFIISVFTLVVGLAGGYYWSKIAPQLDPKANQLNLITLQAVYKRLVSNYDGQIDVNKLLEGSIKGLVYGLGDEHSLYMTSEEAQKFREQLTGDIGGGIGAEIGMRQGLATIVRPLKNNPAFRAGLKAGDVILKINDEEVSGQSLEAVVMKIRGPAGTSVKLTVAREKQHKPLEISVVRAIVDNPSVELSYQGDIALVTIYRFDSDTAQLMRKAAHDLKLAGAKGLILDLRDNSGGVLDAVSGVAGLWIDNQTVVKQKRFNQVVDVIKSSSNQAELADLTTIVLVNENTASASEILAAALRDYNKAKLLGVKTYGKGSVQELSSLAGGQLKLTVAHWFTAKDQSLEKNGLEPDIKVERQDKNNSELDEQLARAFDLLK